MYNAVKATIEIELLLKAFNKRENTKEILKYSILTDAFIKSYILLF
jgi:hypothetical protein